MYAHNSKSLGKCQLHDRYTISEVKDSISLLKKNLPPSRQSILLESKGKTLKDTDTVKSLNLRDGGKLYVKDLGPQIGWSTVFLAEYAGPLFVYLIFYNRPSILYGDTSNSPISLTTQ